MNALQECIFLYRRELGRDIYQNYKLVKKNNLDRLREGSIQDTVISRLKSGKCDTENSQFITRWRVEQLLEIFVYSSEKELFLPEEFTCGFIHHLLLKILEVYESEKDDVIAKKIIENIKEYISNYYTDNLCRAAMVEQFYLINCKI